VVMVTTPRAISSPLVSARKARKLGRDMRPR
jgi:hypothetical protein